MQKYNTQYYSPSPEYTDYRFCNKDRLGRASNFNLVIENEEGKNGRSPRIKIQFTSGIEYIDASIERQGERLIVVDRDGHPDRGLDFDGIMMSRTATMVDVSPDQAIAPQNLPKLPAPGDYTNKCIE